MEEKEGRPLCRISVRGLVEFLLRSGDLEEGSGRIDPEAMQKGSRLHRKIQKQMGSGYQAEVALKLESPYEDLLICLEGRADGLFEKEGLLWVDEIKGTYGDVMILEEALPVHEAQAKCYAHILCLQRGLDQIGVQLTYANLDTDQIRRFRRQFTAAELAAWMQDLLDEWHRWLSFQLAWQRKRDASMQNLEFPFPYRPGQRKIVRAVYHTIVSRRQLFVQAPTGVGKTMSAIFPAVRAMGEGHAQMLFYLTAKTITRTVAWEAFTILAREGLHFKTMVLTAKEKVCLNETPSCNPVSCPYAKGHFDRVNAAVFDLWTSQETCSRETLQAYARKHQVCPFELSLDLAVWMDGVICDYNYVFDPDVYLKRFFGEGQKTACIFLVDEAHNLVERGREMYSASLCREDLAAMRKAVKPVDPKLAKTLGRALRQMGSMKKELQAQAQERLLYQAGASMGLLPITLLQAQQETELLLQGRPPKDLQDQILETYFQIRFFVRISSLVDENYVAYSEMTPQGRFLYRLYCVNPAANLSVRLEKGRGAIFFSATFHPLSYFRRLLSLREDAYGLYVKSPFPAANRLILAAGDVSTRYRSRGYELYRRIARYIAGLLSVHAGNYLIFFPSYRLLLDVYEVYQQEFRLPGVECICQESSMDEAAREDFLSRFQAGKGSLAGFAVLGGIFSEGIDLLGDRLVGAVIVGTGLPQVSVEREVLRGFYEKKGEDGFGNAYRMPGMSKVLQAAGRVIRTSRDRGVILLLDDRFGEREYGPLFPAEWQDRERINLSSLEERVRRFWEEPDSVHLSR